MTGNDDRDNSVVHYEHGVPIVDARLYAIEQKQSEAETRERGYREQQLSTNRAMMVFTGILVLFSALTAVVNGIYLHIAKTSADAAKSAAATADATLKASDRSFNQDERAYLWLYVKGFVKADELSEGELAGLAFQAVNYGKTPAQHVQHYITVTLQDNLSDQSQNNAFDASKKLRRAQSNVGAPVLHGVANPTEYFSVWKDGQLLSKWKAKEISDIEAQRRFLYVAGALEYSDVFGMLHRTEICMYWNTDDEDFDFCGVHNNVE